MKHIAFVLTLLLLLLILLLLLLPGLLPVSAAEDGLSWRPFSYPIHTGASWYPRMTQLTDGTLLCGFDTLTDGAEETCILVTRSTDGGVRWEQAATVVQIPGYDCANANLMQLQNGDVLLACRATGRGSNRDAALLCYVSRDGGRTFTRHSEIVRVQQPGGVWEPYLIMVDGRVAAFYANDSHARMGGTGFQNIEMRLLEEDGKSWGEARIVSNGNVTRSRDGMPVVDRLSDGRYVLVVEANALPDYVMVIRMKISPDGLDWSAPLRTICTPSTPGVGKKCAAPFVAVLPGDVLVVSYQTDDRATENGDGVSVMQIVISRDLGLTWSEPFRPFVIPDGRCAAWNGLYWTGERLFAMTGANFPAAGIYLRTAEYTLAD